VGIAGGELAPARTAQTVNTTSSFLPTYSRKDIRFFLTLLRFPTKITSILLRFPRISPLFLLRFPFFEHQSQLLSRRGETKKGRT
jgi:hypothetical protein